MKLAGDLAEFSLADLLQVQSAAGQSRAFRILTPEGSGTIHMQGGEIVHAAYGDLAGEAAFLALMHARQGYFEGAALPPGGPRTMSRRLPDLLLDAHALAASGMIPKPQPRFALVAAERQPGAARPGAAPSPAGAAPAAETRSQPQASDVPVPRQRRLRNLAVAAVAGGLLLGAGAWWLTAAPAAPAAPAPRAAAGAAESETASEDPIEASSLTPPGDALPELVAGQLPLSPLPDLALKPSIVCRLLIDARGRVAKAEIYRSRLDLATFEDAALQSVQTFRFAPARRAGRPVSVWINWPVEFR